MATNIKSLHSSFAKLVLKLRDEFDKLVKNGTVELITIARSAATYLSIPVSSLKYTDVDELFDSLKPFYDFFNCGVLQHLTDTYVSSTALTDELTQYIDDVDDFSESSQLKHVRSAIEAHLPASSSTSDQTKPVVVGLAHRWDEMTIKDFKSVLKYYFKDEVADLFSHISIKKNGGGGFKSIQLGANPNKDKEGKYPLEIAKEGGAITSKLMLDVTCITIRFTMNKKLCLMMFMNF